MEIHEQSPTVTTHEHIPNTPKEAVLKVIEATRTRVKSVGQRLQSQKVPVVLDDRIPQLLEVTSTYLDSLERQVSNTPENQISEVNSQGQPVDQTRIKRVEVPEGMLRKATLVGMDYPGELSQTHKSRAKYQVSQNGLTFVSYASLQEHGDGGEEIREYSVETSELSVFSSMIREIPTVDVYRQQGANAIKERSMLVIGVPGKSGVTLTNNDVQFSVRVDSGIEDILDKLKKA